MTNNKQSSVQWFFDQLVSHGYIVVNKTTYGDKVKAKHKILLEQAKAMHKEEHGQTWDKSIENFEARGRNEMRAWVDFDEYYNETFEGNNEQQ